MAGLPNSLVLMGAGKMGGAMLEGWLKLGVKGPSVAILDPFPAPSMLDLCAAHGVKVNPPVAEIAGPEVLVLAIKPQMLDEGAAMLMELAGSGTLVVSVIAGKTVGNLAARLPQATKAIVRAMPNTPAAVGRGMTGCWANEAVSADQRAIADALLTSIGRVEWVDQEALIDAVTAVSGSGPAYVFYLAEALAQAGEAAGLPADLAMRLARATVEGAGELMYQDQATPAAQLRQNVTSPGGTTAAALQVLMAEDGLAPLMRRAVAAAQRRAGELSG
ncbi:pyrroline-5-carboxylate reductase [Methylovirgula sp. 4M-Z18]|uniref:pyrroline-5-carboxylate reductase n=1 Tax=Methylovirgula sp. 4M-Z18 TaxID=2293567 RepID=UPI000E2EEE19|nr:pyrroline-5-carboxylate reductase [Methylovirgula sp. 4M-Z18]RFB78386.1 pyrroline-5-carboxylate reductase [Methylovirgula sp. 4M-Z18]